MYVFVVVFKLFFQALIIDFIRCIKGKTTHQKWENISN